MLAINQHSPTISYVRLALISVCWYFVMKNPELFILMFVLQQLLYVF